MPYPTKKLGDIIELKYGKGISRADRSPDGKYPVYGANGILDYTDKYLVEGEAIIVGRKGSAGEITRVSGKFWPSDVTYFVLGNKQIDIDYLFHLFKSFNLQRFAVDVKPGINRNRIYELEIPLPPIEEQRRIVKKLETLMAKIDEAKKLRELALQDSAALLPAALHQIFSRAEEEGWEEKSLGEISVLTRGPFGGSLKKSIFVDKGYKVYEQKNAIYNDFTIGKYFVTKEKFKEMERFAISSEDLIMSCSGTIGRVAIVPDDAQLGIINQALLKISPIKNVVLNSYLKCVLESPILQERIFGNVLGAAIKNIAGVKILKEIKIPLPSIAEQKKIVAHFDLLSEKVRDLRELQQQTQAELNKLSQSILHAAFSGKL